MNREIKFLVWNLDKNKFEDIEWLYMDMLWNLVYQDYDSHWNYWMKIEDYNYELIQYTWLKDKNGKEIFEGDIVRDWWSDEYTIWEVEFFEEGGYFYLWLGWIEEQNARARDCEVIWNIFENPELLNNEK